LNVFFSRWLNGSFFAAIFALSHIFDLFKTEHSFFRKVVLCIQALYNAIMLVFSWFSMANFYIFFVSRSKPFSAHGKSV